VGRKWVIGLLLGVVAVLGQGCERRVPVAKLAIPGRCIERLEIRPGTMCIEGPDGWYDCRLVRVKANCVEVVKASVGSRGSEDSAKPDR
jgi:hypothetical protein